MVSAAQPCAMLVRAWRRTRLCARREPLRTGRRRWRQLVSLLLGRDADPAGHGLTRRLFLTLLGSVYLCAFLSFWSQLDGLVGSNGISPASELLEQVRERHPLDYIRLLPSLCWLSSSDAFLHGLCAMGTLLSVLLITGIASLPATAGLWALYLSLVKIGPDFMSYQWDALLLETGFLAILLSPPSLLPGPTREAAPSPTVLLLLRLVLFKLMFFSGVVKLSSGDPSWWELSAMSFHYQTQPLPTWTSWWMHHLPGWFHQAEVVATFAIELAVPWLIFAPRRRLRLAAWFPLVGLQLVIASTGNYGFFNLLCATLCLTVLDDGALPQRLRQAWARLGVHDAARPRRWPAWLLAPAITTLLLLNLVPYARLVGNSNPLPGPLMSLYRTCQPLALANSYGLFAVMTTERPELIIEGSRDGITWQAYELPWKPGDPARRPRFVTPHMPRLDWQLWFAALSPYRERGWLLRLCERLLEASPEVRGLLYHDPFGDEPPRFIRILRYDYRFTGSGKGDAATGWWRRERTGPAVATLRRP